MIVERLIYDMVKYFQGLDVISISMFSGLVYYGSCSF